ncbi:serine protease [Cohnella faecalis]|nr:serine protease [Cohnella faecalis]
MKHINKKVMLAAAGLILLLGYISISSADPSETSDAEGIYTNAEQAVFYVRALRSDGTIKDTGTGFMIRPDGVALTAYHVVKEADQVACVMNDASVMACPVIAYDVASDTAVLKISPEPAAASEKQRSFPYLPLRASAVKHGEKVFAIGYPMKDTKIVTEGVVNAPRAAVNGRDRILMSADLASGMSGGPLLDRYGKAAGILSGSLRTMNGIHLAVDAEAVNRVLKQANLSASGKEE